jgi:glycosyltransferase involved in cell wall biosynthesis
MIAHAIIMIVGIDASNTASGGLRTHLVQLLKAAQPDRFGIDRVVVWGGRAILDAVDDRPWLRKRHVGALDGGLASRVAWQHVRLPAALRAEACAVLLAPGGSLPLRLETRAVSISQNQLPFARSEGARFGLGWRRLKIALLRKAHGRSFQAADRVIFLTEHARRTVLEAVPLPAGKTLIVPYGLEPRFFMPAAHSPHDRPSSTRPFRLLYVSRIDLYKHQWLVAEAVARLRARGIAVEIDFVGPAHARAWRLVRTTFERLDPEGRFLHYRGELDFEALHEVYQQADGFVFASSCESLPIALIEAMAAGLPLACSRLSAMPEVAGDAAVYFDPTNADEISSAIERLIGDAPLRAELSAKAITRARTYSWARCADETFRALAAVARGSDQAPAAS